MLYNNFVYIHIISYVNLSADVSPSSDEGGEGDRIGNNLLRNIIN